MDRAHAFDKAAWHLEAVRALGLPDRQAYVHGGLFFGWAASRGLVAGWVLASTAGAFEQFRRGALTGPALFALWDGAMLDDLFTDEGLAFVADEYASETGFMARYADTVAAGLPSPFHVVDDAASAARVAELLDRRLAAWRAAADPERGRPDLRGRRDAPPGLPERLVLPVLPVTRGVVFPGGTVTIRAARDASVAAVRRAEATDGYIGLFCLLDPGVGDDPISDDLVTVGVLARVDRAEQAPDGTPALDVVASCRARIEVRSWVPGATLTADVDVRVDPAASGVVAERVAAVRERVAAIVRNRRERGEPYGTLAVAASLDGGALLDLVAREGGLTSDEQLLALGAIDLETRSAIVLGALSR